MKQAGPRALAFCEKPQGATRIALIFGADPGLVSTSADTLAYNWLPWCCAARPTSTRSSGPVQRGLDS